MKFKTFFLVFLLVLMSIGITVNAQEPLDPSIKTIVSAFKKYKDIALPEISVPTVLQVSLDNNEFIERNNFAVFNKTQNKFEPYLFKQENNPTSFNIQVKNINNVNILESLLRMKDNDSQTYTEFALPEDKQGQIQLILTSTQPLTSSKLTLLLDNHVALPNTIEIRIKEDSREKIILAEKEMRQSTVYFPETTADQWLINLTYGQPLRITEIFLTQKNIDYSRSIRFLAHPANKYRIYLEPDRQVNPSVEEAGNLASDQDVLVTQAFLSQPNPLYKIADVDDDNIPDINDNCVTIKNPKQTDINNNGRGDKCDDFDKDGILNIYDNCPDNPNKDQADTDGDGIGDACDETESRFTEKYKWFPWIGIGFAFLVLIILLSIIVKSMRQEGIQLSQKEEAPQKLPDKKESK
jgi:hypothetical protein